MDVNNQVHMVDREDQVKWFLDPKTATTFIAQLDNNHFEVRQWLINGTQDVVVISAQGVMPRIGTSDHAYHSLLHCVQRDQYKFYFKSEDDAMLFKLAWGGSI